MKLLELIEYPAQPDEFELLNLEAPVDQDLLKTIIEERELKLVYNGVLLDNLLDKLLTPFYKEVTQYFQSKGGIDNMGVTAFYDYDTMCIYVEETYKVYDTDYRQGSSKNRLVWERIDHTNTRKKNVIKFLTVAEYNRVVADNPDIINLNELLGF